MRIASEYVATPSGMSRICKEADNTTTQAGKLARSNAHHDSQALFEGRGWARGGSTNCARTAPNRSGPVNNWTRKVLAHSQSPPPLPLARAHGRCLLHTLPHARCPSGTPMHHHQHHHTPPRQRGWVSASGPHLLKGQLVVKHVQAAPQHDKHGLGQLWPVVHTHKGSHVGVQGPVRVRGTRLADGNRQGSSGVGPDEGAVWGRAVLCRGQRERTRGGGKVGAEGGAVAAGFSCGERL